MNPPSMSFRRIRDLTSGRTITTLSVFVFICLGTLSSVEARVILVDDFTVTGNEVVSTEDIKRKLSLYYGPVSPERLEAARQAVLDLYSARGYEMVSVPALMPSRDLTSWRVNVFELKIGNIHVEASGRVNKSEVRRTLPALKEGEPVNLKALSDQLFLANNNPSRELDVKFKEGENQTADATIVVESDKPWTITLSANNTGAETTGRARAGVNFNHVDLWNKGHYGALSITTSPEHPEDVIQIGGFYQIPIVAHGDELSFSASYSETDNGLIADAFDVTGAGSTFGINYKHYLDRSLFHSTTLDVGMTYKDYDNDVLFGPVNLGQDAAALPLRVAATWTRQHKSGLQTSLTLGGRINIPTGGDNSDEVYTLNRVGADASWGAIETKYSITKPFSSGAAVSFGLSGQYAPEPLISAEQFGLGGSRRLRGLEEREFTGDSGVVVNLTAYTPMIAEVLRFSAFLESGAIWRNGALPSEIEDLHVSTGGAGIQIAYRKFRINADLGVVLDGDSEASDGDTFLHVRSSIAF